MFVVAALSEMLKLSWVVRCCVAVEGIHVWMGVAGEVVALELPKEELEKKARQLAGQKAAGSENAQAGPRPGGAGGDRPAAAGPARKEGGGAGAPGRSEGGGGGKAGRSEARPSR